MTSLTNKGKIMSIEKNKITKETTTGRLVKPSESRSDSINNETLNKLARENNERNENNNEDEK
jgi:hypothetical protein